MKISDNGTKLVIGGLAGWIGVAVVIWLFGEALLVGIDDPDLAGIIALLISGLMGIASLVLSAIILLVLGGTYKISSSMGKVWALLGIGILLWLAGEIVYFSYDLQGIEPFPSIADYFYFIGYLPLIVGLVFQMRLLKLTLNTVEKVVVIVLTSIVTLAITIFILYPAISAGLLEEEPDIVALVAGAMYPMLDIVLLAGVFTVSAKLRHGKINAAWILILVGLVLTTVADSIYQITDLTRNPEAIAPMFEWYDLAFLAGYLLIAMGAIKGINVISTSFA